jgi:hypothetical protein
MPIFRFRLEAQNDSGHYRSGSINADTKEAAQLFLEEMERDRAAYQMPTDRQTELCDQYGVAGIEDLPNAAPVDASEDEKALFRQLAVRDRSHLNLHRQEKPYKLVTLEQVGD